jgi:alpha-tubulin suppressor-like RCC1 family protein
LRGQIIDISQFTKSLVKKIVCGTNHCIILFNDGQLAGFGSNEEGQLGFDIKKEGKYLNEIRINKFNFTDPETGQIIDDYQISDIGTGDNFSLILVRSGINRYFLIKFGINAEERYLEDSENIKTINTLNIDYEKIKTISKIFVFGQRSLILTNDDKLFVGGVNFEMKPLSKFKFLHELSRRITGVYLGMGHCLITDCI